MNIAQFLDQFNLGLLFVITVTMLVVFIEIGFRLGKR